MVFFCLDLTGTFCCDFSFAARLFAVLCLQLAMTVSLHPAIATSAGVILVVSYLYVGYWISTVNDEGVFDVPTVLASLLKAEAAAVPRHGASVAVAFGSCRDRLASGVDVMNRLGLSCPESVTAVNELRDIGDLEKTFCYYFKNGVSARSVYFGSFSFITAFVCV